MIVNTSAGSMGGGPTGVWLSELADPYYAFQAAGLEVTVAFIVPRAAPSRSTPTPWASVASGTRRRSSCMIKKPSAR